MAKVSIDMKRTTEMLERILTGANSFGLKTLFVKPSALYKISNVSNWTRKYFQEQIPDILTGTSLQNKVGDWLYTEYDDGDFVFLKIENYSKRVTVEPTSPNARGSVDFCLSPHGGVELVAVKSSLIHEEDADLDEDLDDDDLEDDEDDGNNSLTADQVIAAIEDMSEVTVDELATAVLDLAKRVKALEGENSKK